MTDKGIQVLNALIAKLELAYPTATVKSGWASSYLRTIERWPLITVAPIVTNGAYQGQAVKDDMQFHIQVVDHEADEPETLPSRLIQYMGICRKALFSQNPRDRFNNWQGLLNGQPTEGAETRFIEPTPGQPYAGLSIILTTTYSQTME